MRFTLLPIRLVVFSLLALVLVSCNSSGSGSGGSFSISLSTSMLLAPQDGTPASVSVAVTGTSASVTLSAGGVPSGVSVTYKQPGTTGAGGVAFIASPSAAAGTYSIDINANDGNRAAAPQSLTLVVAVATVVSTTTDTTLGINGQLKQFMSTSFQPAEWDYTYFSGKATEPAQLNTLGPQHIRLQGISDAVPWRTNSNPQAAGDWDFTELDAIVQPVLSVADHSPEFQIAVAPPFLENSSGEFNFNSPNLQTFVSYCQYLVRYYNTGGFDWGGQHFQSPSPYPITWWGIFNEYNINGLTPAEYVQMYNAVVPAMLTVDPTIKISALELSDYDYENGDPRNNLPTFVAPVASSGVNAQVDVASTHFYSSCNQNDTDTMIFATVPGFVTDLKYFETEFALRPDLGNVAIWVTENNVNADYSNANGNSTCNPGQKFVPDQRGTSAFFAAWRPYVYSQFAKAGNQALFHWDYDADVQYGEVDYNTGNKYLSYWVDYTLGQMFPVTAASWPAILAMTSTESSSANPTTEALATKNLDGSFVIMITNRAVHSSSDNNGTGDPRTVVIDVSALGNYTSVSELFLQANTDVTNGPQPQSLTPAPLLSVTLNGYGTAFLMIKP